MKQDILIVPCHGQVEVLQDTNKIKVVFCDIERNKKLKGYTLRGRDWQILSECVPSMLKDDWDWSSYITGKLDTDEDMTEEQAHVLCYFLRKSEVQYLILADDGSGRYRFLLYSDAKIHTDFCRYPVIEITGMAPYASTIFDGEVEIAGRAVDLADKCIEDGLWQTQGWEHNQK